MTPPLRLTVAIGALAALGASAARAQRAPRIASAPATESHPRYDSKLFSDPDATSNRFKALRWRNVGPFRGGRVVAIAGDPLHQFTAYFGAVNGGVWKTTNGGQTWFNITDGKTDISSVGAVAVAPSDPNVIYVGTGEAQMREDLTYGTGMYRSTDAGDTWQQIGLGDTQQIAAVRVDPGNPDRVFVAAMGHAFGPNAERGVFRTLDGGKTWQKVLFLNDSTGAIDLSMDVQNPRILYAAMWKFQRTPWGMDAGGGRSGLWKTTDGGDTWKELTFNPGIPRRLLGKIGVSVSPANPDRVYAAIEAPDSLGGIYRSDDGGAHWTATSLDQKWSVRPFYYEAVTADPNDENTVYTMNLGTWRSVDGGRTFSRLRVPHGDTHITWVDPNDSRHLMNGNDGGATISYDNGVTWSSIYNQPTAQFYHVITDNQFPYHIYGAQQDNSAVSVASRSDDGSIGERDYFDVAGCENATIAVDPRNPNVTYGGCYMGQLSRYDHATRQERDISVRLMNYDGYAPADVPDRFQWTFPVMISPHDPTVLYAASQRVWRSRTEGASWEPISPDLTVNDPKTTGPSGGPIHYDMTGTEWYATIYALAESPVTQGVLWAGSDDGLIHVSRDGGASWQRVTPPGYGKFTRTAGIDASHFDAGRAYVAANRYQQDDFTPYLWKTADYGRTWTSISAGIPMGAYTRSIREDPVRRGLLYAATEAGVYVSFNDGTSWDPLQLNLPRTSVRDLTVHGNDLVAATHGRGFWEIDDISLLRAMADSVTSRAAYLFAPAKAVAWAGYRGRSLTAGENPASGAYVDYWLKGAPTTAISLQFLDPAGKLIRTYTSATAKADSLPALNDSLARAADAARADSTAHEPADSVVSARAGTNRFVWNLQYPGAKQLKNTVLDEGSLDGPVAPPGHYTVRLIAGRDTLSRQFDVVPDPRVTTTTADLVAQFDQAMLVQGRINAVVEAAQRAEDLQAQLDARVKMATDSSYAKRVADAATAVRRKIEGVRTELYEVGCHEDECTLDQPIKLYNKLISLNYQVQVGANPPTKQHGEIYADLSHQVDVQLQQLQQIEDTDLNSLNALLEQLNLPKVFVPAKPKIVS